MRDRNLRRMIRLARLPSTENVAPRWASEGDGDEDVAAGAGSGGRFPSSHEIVAEWRFPFAPVIRVAVDGQFAAEVNYSPASASLHWSLRWRSSDPDLPRGVTGLATLASQVPEDIDGSSALQAAALDATLEAIAAQLCRHATTVVPRDA